MNLIAPDGRLPWWIALPTAALGGWMFDLANPGIAAWGLTFPAVLLILASWWQQRLGVAALAGFAAGAAFWLPHISWLTLYLGPIPWLALGTVMILWFVVQALATAAATRGIAVLLAGRPRRVLLIALQALAATGIWVLREGVQGVWPYGGFAWGRIAHTFAESPFGSIVSWVGFTGLTALIVLGCAMFVAGAFAFEFSARDTAEFDVAVIDTAVFDTAAMEGAATHAAGRDSQAVGSSVPAEAPVKREPRAFVPAFIVAVVIALISLVPPASVEETGTLRVAGIQGNSKSAIFDDRESGDVFADHVRATENLLDELEEKGEHVDLVVWPENAGEFGLNANPLRGREVALLSQRADAPIVIGTVLEDDDGTYWNSSIVWGPRGQQRPTETSRYDKRFPVPFAEYMPNRSFFHALVPDLVDLVQLEYSFGTRSAVMPIDTTAGAIQAAIAICFDIIFDNQAVEMVAGDAGLILAQSNNADFGHTDESVQQLQIARLRAIETGRAVINISTVGTSVIIAPDGTNLAEIEPFTSGAIVSEVPIVSGATPALTFGAAISSVWMLVGAAGLLAGIWGLFLLRLRGLSLRRFSLRGSASGAE